jgi:DNA primase
MRDIIYREAERRLRYIKMSGPDNVGGPCPFHKGGMEKNPSFYINLSTGLFYCHSCKIKGTFVQFLKLFNAPRTLIDTILELGKREPKYKKRVKLNSGIGEHVLNESLLGVFQFCPTDLVNEGFDAKLLQKLEVGFDKEEMRIIFPIRDLHGNLVGLSGRTVINVYPRYKVYKSPDILKYAPDDPEVIARYKEYDIKNHNYLWNLHNVYPSAFFGDLDTVIIVEGYKACIWMLQQGFENVVALQGSSLTQAQGQLLGRLGVTIILFLDNNQAGKEGTYTTGWWLRRNGHRVLAVTYPDWCDESAQPDNLEQPDILGVLDAAEDWHHWRNRNDAILSKAKKLIRSKSKGLYHQA